MTVFKKLIFIMFSILLMGVSMSCANEAKDNCIIFWDYNPELSLEYLESSSYSECVNKFHDYIKIEFSGIEKFDSETQVFTLKEDFNYPEYGHQYFMSQDGKLFASIVVDGKIVLNAVNGSIFLFLTPSADYPVTKTNVLIYAQDEKNIIISNRLSWEIFVERNTISKAIKKIISEKIK